MVEGTALRQAQGPPFDRLRDRRGQNRSSPDSKGPPFDPFDWPLDAALRVQGRPFDRPLDATLRVQELSGRKELGGAVQTLKQVQGDGLRSGDGLRLG